LHAYADFSKVAAALRQGSAQAGNALAQGSGDGSCAGREFEHSGARVHDADAFRDRAGQVLPQQQRQGRFAPMPLGPRRKARVGFEDAGDLAQCRDLRRRHGKISKINHGNGHGNAAPARFPIERPRR
jgi:hypothetical protein